MTLIEYWSLLNQTDLRNLHREIPPPKKALQPSKCRSGSIREARRRKTLTSSPRLFQNLLLTYRLLPSSTTRRPNSFVTPSTLFFRGSGPLNMPQLLGIFFSSFSVLTLVSPASLVTISSTFTCSSPFSSSSSKFFPRCCTTPSSRRNLANSSASGGFRLRRGARPGPGKTHSMSALVQFEHGCRLSHRTFLFLHVTQDLGLGCGAEEAPSVCGDSVLWRLLEAVVGGPLLMLELLCAMRGDVVVWTGLVEKSVSNS